MKEIKSKNVYLTNVDKNNNIVILDKEVYDERVHNLNEEGSYEVVEQDPRYRSLIKTLPKF